MPLAPSLASDPAVATSRAILQRVAGGYTPRDFAVRFWDGSIWDAEPVHSARFSLVLSHAGSVRKMFWPPDGVSLGEAYVYGEFDVEGDMSAYMRFCRHLHDWRRTVRENLALAWLLFRLPAGGRPRSGHAPARLRGRKHSLQRDRLAVGYAYDTSNEFYGLWLDENLLYTCAYFLTPDDTLVDAQRQKMDHVCRKLRLRPGERLLDIGCGWGGLVVHAAKYYGVEAVGATLSRNQADFATERIQREGLAGRCRVEYQDYREIKTPTGFDKLSCIGMLEHLGGAMMPTFFRAAWGLLRPGGVFLNHGITRPAHVPVQGYRKFARKYVFPDGELEPINVTIRHAEEAGFEVRDVENLREHYTLTLGHWLRRLEERRAEAVRVVGEATYRVFRLYLAGAQAGMRGGIYNLHQTLLAKPDSGVTGLPLTRGDWYK